MTSVIFRPDAPTWCVGPRPPAGRRLFLLGLVTMASAFALIQAAPSVDRMLNTGLGQVVTHLETEHAETRLGLSVRDQISAFNQSLLAEDAWAKGDFVQASRLWLEQAQQPAHAQDLTLVGWGLRAAARAQDPRLMAQAIHAWNTLVPRLPAGMEAAPLSPAATAAHDVYLQIVAMAADTTGSPVPSEAEWMNRAPTAMEVISDTRMCGTPLGCDADPALPWGEMQSLVSARIKGWKNRGFAPQQAWDLYRERQMLGDSDHEVSSRHHQSLTPAEQLRLVMRAHLGKVHTPADLDSYWALWPVEAERLSVNLVSEQQVGILGGLRSREVNWPARLTGRGSGWPDHHLLPTTSWQRLQAVMVYQLSHLPVGSVPAGITPVQADKRLLQAVQQSGLSQLRWPSAFPSTPQVKWRLATLIEEANHHLEQATGWTGPVLGHAGHTVLDLASSPGGLELGFQAPMAGPRSAVIMASVIDRDSLGALAHEWTHANDYFIGQSGPKPGWATEQAASSVARPLQAWSETRKADASPTLQLWDALLAPDMSPTQRTIGALEGWVARQAAQQPERRAHWLEQAARWRRGEPQQDMAGRALADLVQVTAVASRSPRFHSSQADLSSSVWVQTSRIDDAKSYWGNPSEMVARSFEAQQGHDRVLSSRDQSAWVYYPQGVEKVWQEKAWQAYFQEQASWWTRWCHTSVPSLTDRTPASPLLPRIAGRGGSRPPR